MSANAIGKYLPFTASPKTHVGATTHERERRATVRASLHWPVLFRHRQAQTLESITENLSSQGFYCLSEFPVPSGELLVCWLTVPTHDPSGAKEKIVLECEVRVIRSEAAAEGLYGIACRIEDYRFGNPQAAFCS